jgi:hypothetical protein
VRAGGFSPGPAASSLCEVEGNPFWDSEGFFFGSSGPFTGLPLARQRGPRAVSSVRGALTQVVWVVYFLFF